MIHFGLFDESEENMLRKCIVFYAAISAKDINKTFDTKAIDSITERKIKTDLLPVIKRRDGFELESAKRLVKEYITDLMVLTTEVFGIVMPFHSLYHIHKILMKAQILCQLWMEGCSQHVVLSASYNVSINPK